MILTYSMNVLLMFALTLPALAGDGDAPRIQINQVKETKKVSLVMEGLSSQVEIEVRANDGNVLLRERLRGEANVTRLLSLEELPAGRYLIVVETSMQDILQPVEISDEGMVLNQGTRTSYFAPAVRVQDRQVDVTWFNTRVTDVELTIFTKRSEKVYEEKIDNVVQLQKRMNLGLLPAGLYTIKVLTPYKAYYKDIVLK